MRILKSNWLPLAIVLVVTGMFWAGATLAPSKEPEPISTTTVITEYRKFERVTNVRISATLQLTQFRDEYGNPVTVCGSFAVIEPKSK